MSCSCAWKLSWSSVPCTSTTMSCSPPHTVLFGQSSSWQCRMRSRSASPSWGQEPDPCATNVTPRRRSCRPGAEPASSLQAREQGDHSPQSPSSQSLSQLPTSHSSRSAVTGQALPPCDAWTCTVRSRLRTPPPQDRLQELQSSHSFIAQSAAQGTSPHGRRTSKGGQRRPFGPGGTSCFLAPSIQPGLSPRSEQVTVHAEKVQSETSQSCTGRLAFALACP
mmetsp:Transcript_72411/g.212167  ORF Transcript_72411/g.212167 Transcript_72411/m.212167 type:complete len:222 (+) Transcript_72411:554-1219(+)